MTDRRLQALKRQAVEEGSHEAWLALEDAIYQAGQDGSEIFNRVLESLELALAPVDKRLTELRVERNQWITDNSPKRMVCSACDGRGYIRHWDTEYDCSRHNEKLIERTDYSREIELAGYQLFGERIEEVEKQYDQIHGYLIKYKDALTPGLGALVQLERGRPKWKETGLRVEVGTCGIIVYMGTSSWDGSPMALVKNDDGVFFTAMRNLSDKAYNPWYRLRGRDPESLKQAAKEKALLDNMKIANQRFPNGLKKGDRVRYGGKAYRVFWSKEERLGLKSVSQPDPTWVNIWECEPWNA